MALYRKYRPQKFSDVSGQEHVVRTIQNQFGSESLSHAYLFTGPRGVGKTTVARLVAKLANCEKPKKHEPCEECAACLGITNGGTLDFFEIDAASHTDVDNVRENIIKNVRFSPQQLKKKVFIIDEVHMLSTSAFNALLKTLEEPPEHALFVLATTEIHKVPETIISRCQRFDFKRVSTEELVKRLNFLSKEEGFKVDEDVLKEVAKHSEGCVRDAESLLGQIFALGDKNISLEQAMLVLPATNHVFVEAFFEALFTFDSKKTIDLLNSYLEQGIDVRQFLDDIVEMTRLEMMNGLSSGKDVSIYVYAIEEFLIARRNMSLSTIDQLPLEIAVVKICSSAFQKRGVDSGLSESEKASPVYVEEPIVEDESDKEEKDSVEKTMIADEAVSEPIVSSEKVDTNESDKVFDTVPVISLEEVQSKWPEVYDQIKDCNASLPLFMKSCEVGDVKGDRVELAFGYDLYVQTVNQQKNREVIEQVLGRVLGKKLKIHAVKKESEDAKTLDSLVDAFGGSVV